MPTDRKTLALQKETLRHLAGPELLVHTGLQRMRLDGGVRILGGGTSAIAASIGAVTVATATGTATGATTGAATATGAGSDPRLFPGIAV